jgi:starch phosphorylase
MAHLAIVGSHSVNGVSALHTQILKDRVLRDFYEFYPERFNNKTNGITPRRWLKKANAPLAGLITDAIGDGWVTDLTQLRKLTDFADNEEFQNRWREVKQLNKDRLAGYVRQKHGFPLDSGTLLDCQVKRFHDYKRQLLNILHVITLYNRLKTGRDGDFVPRTVLFAGKAAPGYYHAKMTIKLANAVGEVVNNDPDIAGRLRVAFLPDYGVSLAEQIIPAAELSEQISTAGMEASGTGNMKFALNGALTIGTLDGANIEIREAVGHDNIFVFGLTADEVEQRLSTGSYDPWRVYAGDLELAEVIDAIRDGDFVNGDDDLLRHIWSALMEHGDRYMHLADFRAYVEAQRRAEALYSDQRAWAAAAIRNIAAMGYFSSDRAIREYSDQIWRLEPVQVEDEG